MRKLRSLLARTVAVAAVVVASYSVGTPSASPHVVTPTSGTQWNGHAWVKTPGGARIPAPPDTTSTNWGSLWR
jgi:hypothetical protein